LTALAGIHFWQTRFDVEDPCANMLSVQAAYGSGLPTIVKNACFATGIDLKKTVPEDQFDTQPLSFDGDILVADLRIDNRNELAAKLRLSKEQLAISADSLLLQRALQKWGEQAVDHLVGPYAFAWWQARQQTLILIRDPMGHRPLHYFLNEQFCAFSSMPSGLLALPEVPKAPDLNRLSYLIALTPYSGGETFFSGIFKVPTGHIVKIQQGKTTSVRFWNPQPKPLILKDDRDYAFGLREVLTQATESCLRGATDAASHLSGGRDSSSVTAIAAQIQAQRGYKLHAYTAIPRLGTRDISAMSFSDESLHATAVAQMYPNIKHHFVAMGGANPIANLDRYFDLYQKPIFNLNNFIWIERILSDVKAQNLHVLLVGQTGNATISYAGREWLAESFKQAQWNEWLKHTRSLVHSGYGSWPSALVGSLKPWIPGSLWRFMRDIRRVDASTASIPGSALDTSLIPQFIKLRRQLERLPTDGHAYRVKWLQKSDSWTENKGFLAAWGVDVRDPTADMRVIDYCLSVPTSKFIAKGVPSSLLRTAMANDLPALILNEHRKGRQAADWHEDFLTSKDAMLNQLQSLANNRLVMKVLDIPLLIHAVKNNPQAGWQREDVHALYNSALLRGISAGHFIQRASLA
jgi:asparagine synthase (glutamine-hydrolysing)